ncbi:hypothetical protein FHS95_001878 [Sphingomonas naasensis]|uniref:Uncharacterized protein n=1 Tax=Sphingomonas naasensis TaxID=1344951 RepID=A0A4S1WM24_9SPHN|nr:hypothetical protein [Sphingomonas naasensis]NIJ20186.1 hypothetical protein [Sphingomonas naasensis]TGX44334.1 hypothetical protein E5A74_05910 [Sphingomonas naasensis]
MRTLATAALLVCAAPAHAADLATIDCVAGKMAKGAVAQLHADVSRNMTESGKRPSYDPAVGGSIASAAVACGLEHNWSEAAIKAARVYTLAKVGMPVAQRVIGERGFDAAELEDRFLALPEEARNRALTAAETGELIKASVSDEAKQTRANAELLAEYFAFLSTIQYASFDFSQA